MNIQWYPGHMAKTVRELQTLLSKVDAAVELVDARIPVSGRNPALDRLLQNKPRVVVLNRTDLADPNETSRWIRYFKEKGIPAIACNAKTGEGCNQLRTAVNQVLADKLARREQRGIGAMTLRLMIVGIPNVGKSSLINRLTGKKIARAEDRPGITRSNTWIRLPDGSTDLLDTPGLLWPKLDPPEAGLHLAYTGAVKDDILDTPELASHLALDLFRLNAPIFAGYTPETPDDPEVSEIAMGFAMLEHFAKKRGFLQRGGVADTERAAAVLLDEYRAGKLGRYTWEPVGYTYPVPETEAEEEP